MSDAQRDIFLLAREPGVRGAVEAVVPDVRAGTTALELLADMAASPDAAALVASVGCLGYRREAILGAVRRAWPEMPVYLLCRSEDEPDAARAAEADDYFVLPRGLAALSRRLFPATERSPRSQTAMETAAGEPAPSALPAAMACLKAVAVAAGSPAGEIAAEGVSQLARIDGVSAAAVLTGGDEPRVLASVPGDAGWAAELAALVRADAEPDRWHATDERTLLWPAEDATHVRSGLALRCRAAGDVERLQGLDELATVARVSLAVTSASRAREAAVRVLATDPETGLASRRYFLPYLSALCRRAGRERREVALVLVSPAGNALMARSAVQSLADVLRGLDGGRPARLDAFTLAAAVVGQPAGMRLDDLAGAVEAADVPMPVAVAAATFPWDAHDADDLLRVATDRLAASRSSGRPVVE